MAIVECPMRTMAKKLRAKATLEEMTNVVYERLIGIWTRLYQDSIEQFQKPVRDTPRLRPIAAADTGWPVSAT